MMCENKDLRNCDCKCCCVKQSDNWFLGALPWFIPTIVTVVLAFLGASSFKGVKHFDYAYKHCEKSLEKVEESVDQIQGIYLSKVSTFMNSGVFGALLNEKFYTWSTKERKRAIDDMLKLLEEQNGDSIEKYNKQLNKLSRMIRSSNPTLNRDVEAFKTFDLATLLVIHRGEIDQRKDTPETVRKFHDNVKHLYREMSKQIVPSNNEKAINQKLESLELDFDHLQFLKECVANTHKVLNEK